MSTSVQQSVAAAQQLATQNPDAVPETPATPSDVVLEIAQRFRRVASSHSVDNATVVTPVKPRNPIVF